MGSSYFLLWLEAPMQSWGFDSKFDRRDSLDFPTKSGIMGLLACAIGKRGDQQQWLKEYADLDLQVMAYAYSTKKSLHSHFPELESEAFRQPLLRDYQTVGGGYDAKDPWQSQLIPKKSDGKKAVGGGTKITHRYYLQDMAFAVLLEVPSNECELLACALCNPVWDIFLGRKNCIPTEFIFQGEFPTVEEARVAATTLSQHKNRIPAFQVLQGVHEGKVLTLNDVITCLGPQKRYQDRRVTVVQEWQARE